MVFSFSFPFVNHKTFRIRSYAPVPASDEETLQGSLDDKGTLTTKSKRTLDASFLLTGAAILSIAITIWNLFVIQLYSLGPDSNILEASFARPYNGLEKISRNESSPSWPLSSTHYPDFVGSTEGRFVHHALNNGSVVRLDPERRVILQHRIRDYGLERCAVKVEFSYSTKKQHTTRAYGHIGENPYFSLWRVVDDSESNAVLASSAFPTPLPSHREFLGNITLDKVHATQSSFFKCSSGSVQTLEIALACDSDPCIMEFRLTKSPKRQGFRIIQSE